MGAPDHSLLPASAPIVRAVSVILVAGQYRRTTFRGYSRPGGRIGCGQNSTRGELTELPVTVAVGDDLPLSVIGWGGPWPHRPALQAENTSRVVSGSPVVVSGLVEVSGRVRRSAASASCTDP
jgi:hypothetical protein